MSPKRAVQTSAAIDRIGQKYRLWLSIPLIIAAALAVWSRAAALTFLIFMLFCWLFLGAIGLLLRAARILLPESLSHEHRAEIEQSMGITLFLGGCALAGMVLHSENTLSELVARSLPTGFHVSLIDPTFAVVCIIGIWLYTAYRIRRQ